MPKEEGLKLRRWWPFYSVLFVLGFVVPQWLALTRNQPGRGNFTAGTFSETWFTWLSTGPGIALWASLTVGLVGFAVWFPVHLRRAWPWERRADERRARARLVDSTDN